MEGSRLVISVKAETEDHYIDLIQVENTSAGIRKTLFRAAGDDGRGNRAEVSFPATANGTYSFYAYDEGGRSESRSVRVTEIRPCDINEYIETARLNRQKDEIPDRSLETGEQEYKGSQVLLLGGGEGYHNADSSKEKYSVWTSGSYDHPEEETGVSKYTDWNMLRLRKSSGNIKAWYEPLAEPAPQTLDNRISLADYETGLFKADAYEPYPEAKNDISKAASGKDPVFSFERISEEGKSVKEGNSVKKIMIIAIFVISLILLSTVGILIRKRKDPASEI
jgi:hypothetical protein